MAKSYNQIVTFFRDNFATPHFIIKSFGNGEKWELVETMAQADAEYPKMWAEDQPNTLAQGEETFNYRVYFVDQVATLKEKTATTLGEDNLNEVKSNMRQCAQDFISFLVQDTDNTDLTLDRDKILTPFTDILNDKLTGWYVDIALKQFYRASACNLPLAGVVPPPSETCDDATILINGVSFTVVASGATEDIVVKDTEGDVVGSKIGDEWIVPAGVTVLNTANLYKTGQTTSFGTGDDGDLQNGRGTNYTTLDYTSPAGNTNRFTDELLGQTYANNIVIDWKDYDQIGKTVCGWYRIPGTSSNWTTARTSANALSVGTFTTGWHLPNILEMAGVLQFQLTGANLILVNYSPFNIDITGGSSRLWTGTRGEASRQYAVLENGNMQPVTATNLQSWIGKRIFTLTELGL